MQSYRVCACGVQSLTQGALNLNFKIEFSLTRNGNVIVIGTYYPFKMEIRSMQEGSRVYRRRIQTFSMRGARFFLEKKSDFKTICFKKNHRTLRKYSVKPHFISLLLGSKRGGEGGRRLGPSSGSAYVYILGSF
jgi:hypothetical protein